MSDFDPDAYLATAHSDSFDPDEHLTQAVPDKTTSGAKGLLSTFAADAGYPITAPIAAMKGIGENLVRGVGAGVDSIRDALTFSDPGTHKGLTTSATTPEGKGVASAISLAGSKISSVYDQLFGTGPAAQTIKERLPEAASAAGTVAAAGSLARPGAEAAAPPRIEPTIDAPLTATGSPRAPAWTPPEQPPVVQSGQGPVAADTEPVEGGLPAQAQNSRGAILQRVGLENARNSALEGNAKDAATDFQLAKFDEPAGVQAKSQFGAERQALEKHSENIVKGTGGTLGTDEDSLINRGQTIAAPFDALSDWFDTQRKSLYSAADQKAGGNPITNLEGVDSLFKDPTFRNTLLAKDQGGLLSSMQDQLDEFRKQSPDGFNVKGSEQYRQWLNQIWSNDNKYAIGQVKGALDTDVLKGAGEDIYGPARKLVQMKAQTLDNPNGIASLMEKDPQTPINRTTPYEKIPDTLTRLPSAQFDQVIKTLHSMPEEIQPQAQAAIGEIKAHLANKLNDAGASTANQWNAPAVNKVLKANSAKFQSAFADDPQTLQKINDLKSAGNILRVDQTYPGAAAQAANALKRGFMSKTLSHFGGLSGAAAGSTLGPLGAAGGAAVGEALGSAIGNKASEGAAVRKWQQGVTKLSDLVKPSP